MQKHFQLRQIFEIIQKDVNIHLAIVFGSYAKSSETKSSDIDIFIENIDKKTKDYLESVNSRLSIKTGRFDKNTILGKEIIRDMIIIKGVDNFYERFS